MCIAYPWQILNAGNSLKPKEYTLNSHVIAPVRFQHHPQQPLWPSSSSNEPLSTLQITWKMSLLSAMHDLSSLPLALPSSKPQGRLQRSPTNDSKHGFCKSIGYNPPLPWAVLVPLCHHWLVLSLPAQLDLSSALLWGRTLNSFHLSMPSPWTQNVLKVRWRNVWMNEKWRKHSCSLGIPLTPSYSLYIPWALESQMDNWVMVKEPLHKLSSSFLFSPFDCVWEFLSLLSVWIFLSDNVPVTSQDPFPSSFCDPIGSTCHIPSLVFFFLNPQPVTGSQGVGRYCCPGGCTYLLGKYLSFICFLADARKESHHKMLLKKLAEDARKLNQNICERITKSHHSESLRLPFPQAGRVALD